MATYDSTLVTNRGELWLANRLKDGVTDGAGTAYTLAIRLIRADFTVADATNMEDLSIANFDGYSNKTISSSDITASTISDKAVMNLNNSATTTWTKSGATTNQIYGYMISINGESQAQPALVYVKFLNSSSAVAPVPLMSDGTVYNIGNILLSLFSP